MTTIVYWWIKWLNFSKITLHKSYNLIDGRFNLEWIRNIYHSRYNAKGTGSKNTINELDYLPCCLQAFLRCATLAIWLFAFRSAISNHNYYISMGKLWQLKYFYCPNVLKTNVLVLLMIEINADKMFNSYLYLNKLHYVICKSVSFNVAHVLWNKNKIQLNRWFKTKCLVLEKVKLTNYCLR